MARRNDDSEHIKEYSIKDHKFMTMEAEKRNRVIDVALKDFSKGYLEANMDTIAKEAGISKGLLFHYFGSKRGVFLFLIKYTLDIYFSEYEKAMSKSHDFLENIRIGSKLKMELSLRYPLIFGFLLKAYTAIKDVFPEGLPEDLPYSSHMVEAMEQICQKSDHEKTPFKEGIDEKKAQNIIIWTMNGFIDSLLRYGDDIDAYKAHYDEMVKELDEYLQILRKTLYR
ncbi:MAG: TetR/AcrR family transcriptional regulator [Lacrimispora sp.]